MVEILFIYCKEYKNLSYRQVIIGTVPLPLMIKLCSMPQYTQISPLGDARNPWVAVAGLER